MDEPRSAFDLQVCAALRWKDGVLQGYFVKLDSYGVGYSPSMHFSEGKWIDVPTDKAEAPQ